MNRNAGRLAFAAARVVMGSKVLSLGEKIVWLEDRALDFGPEGAYIANAAFERRWGGGLTAATIGEYRRRLKVYGLHESVPRPGAKSLGWISTLPAGCLPRSSRPTDEEIEQLAVSLDAHIRERQSPNERSGRTPTGVVLGVQSGLDSEPNVRRAEGGRGEAPPSKLSAESTLPSAFSSERGVRARAQMKRGGEPLSSQELADFRDGIERDYKAGKITRANRDLMMRMAVNL